MRKLTQLDNAEDLNDLRIPPGNKLEKLSGERAGRHSIGITIQLMPPVHPGELLREEFLKPMGITAYQLAKDIGVPAPRVYDIVREKRGISPDTALRLSRYFGMSEGYWINAQAHYEKEIAKDRGWEKIEREVRPRLPV